MASESVRLRWEIYGTRTAECAYADAGTFVLHATVTHGLPDHMPVYDNVWQRASAYHYIYEFCKDIVSKRTLSPLGEEVVTGLELTADSTYVVQLNNFVGHLGYDLLVATAALRNLPPLATGVYITALLALTCLLERYDLMLGKRDRGGHQLPEKFVQSMIADAGTRTVAFKLMYHAGLQNDGRPEGYTAGVPVELPHIPVPADTQPYDCLGYLLGLDGALVDNVWHIGVSLDQGDGHGRHDATVVYFQDCVARRLLQRVRNSLLMKFNNRGQTILLDNTPQAYKDAAQAVAALAARGRDQGLYAVRPVEPYVWVLSSSLVQSILHPVQEKAAEPVQVISTLLAVPGPAPKKVAEQIATPIAEPATAKPIVNFTETARAVPVVLKPSTLLAVPLSILIPSTPNPALKPSPPVVVAAAAVLSPSQKPQSKPIAVAVPLTVPLVPSKTPAPSLTVITTTEPRALAASPRTSAPVLLKPAVAFTTSAFAVASPPLKSTVVAVPGASAVKVEKPKSILAKPHVTVPISVALPAVIGGAAAVPDALYPKEAFSTLVDQSAIAGILSTYTKGPKAKVIVVKCGLLETAKEMRLKGLNPTIVLASDSKNPYQIAEMRTVLETYKLPLLTKTANLEYRLFKPLKPEDAIVTQLTWRMSKAATFLITVSPSKHDKDKPVLLQTEANAIENLLHAVFKTHLYYLKRHNITEPRSIILNAFDSWISDFDKSYFGYHEVYEQLANVFKQVIEVFQPYYSVIVVAVTREETGNIFNKVLNPPPTGVLRRVVAAAWSGTVPVYDCDTLARYTVK